MRRVRFSIGGMMGVVAMICGGIGAVRNASEPWAGGMLLLTCGVLALAVVGAVARRGARRTWWLGFCLFGWGYLILSGYESDKPSSSLPTTRLLEILGPRLGTLTEARGNFNGRPIFGFKFVDGIDPNFVQIGHCLCAILAALLGGVLASVFFGPPGREPEAVPSEDGETIPRRDRWLPPTIAGLVAIILVGAIATARSEDKAPLWASLTFAPTCAFSGMTALGAILARGRRRARWMGAALFGAGYTALVFSQPAGDPPRTHLATDAVLKGLRAELAPLAKGLFPAHARILEALDRPVPMSFPDETPLADLLAYIKQATSTPEYPGIPIYVDPIGLQEAERSLNSTVQIDLEGVPLRETLRLCLKQLGLAYEVEHGYVRIFCEDGAEDRSPGLNDPDLIVGHCLLAMLAAGFGAMVAPIVAGSAGVGRGFRSDRAV